MSAAEARDERQDELNRRTADVGGQPSKTLTGCLRCWQALKSRSNDSSRVCGRFCRDN